MKVYLVKVLLIISAAFFALNVQAEDLKISGAIDVYHASLSGKDNSASDPISLVINHNEFALGSADFELEKKINEKVNSKLAFRAQDFSGTLFPLLLEGYLSYKPIEALTIQAGQMETFLGLESYKVINNSNYSGSIAGSVLSPLFLTGVKLAYAINEMMEVSLYSVNRSDISDSGDDNEFKSNGFSFAYNGGALGAKLNVLAGKDGASPGTSNQVIEALVTYKLSDALDFAFVYDMGTSEVGDADAQKLNSIIIYGNYHSLDFFDAGIRLEQFVDSDNKIFTGLADSVTVTSITATFDYLIEKESKVRAEYRMESANEDVFSDADGKATNSRNLMLVSLMTSF